MHQKPDPRYRILNQTVERLNTAIESLFYASPIWASAWHLGSYVIVITPV